MSQRLWMVVSIVGGLLAIAFLVSVLTIGKNEGKDMAKERATIDTLCANAVTAIDAKDWPTAFEVCNILQAKRGGAAMAHAWRGKAYEDQGKLVEADIEYDASYKLGNHVASISLLRVRKKMKAGA